MKHYIKHISLCLLLAAGFTSCETDDETELRDVRDVGGYAHLTTPRISQFDTDSDLTVRLFTASGVSVETVEIVSDEGAVLGNATIDGDTATFSSSILGEIAEGTYPVVVRATLSNGNISERPFNITAVNSLSLSADNPEEATLAGLDTTEVGYSIYNLEATVDDVDLHLKNGSEGNYMESGVDDFEDDSVELGDTNYQTLNLSVNDTLYYRFTATSGTLSQAAESFIVIVEEEPDDDDDDNDEDN